MDAEAKLAAYRAAKARQEKIDKFKASIRNFLTFKKPKTPILAEEKKLIENEKQKSTNETNEEPPKDRSTMYRRGKQVVVFTTWVLLYVLFIRLEFGIIYLIVSALIGMYYNTRTDPRNESEVSAYSVFNRNCESIDGTLKAEQFEREIRFGAQSVH